MNIKPNIRYLFDLKDVLYDQKWLSSAKNQELYYMYRGVETENALFQETDLRYDITEIPYQELGQEFIKTLGHYHFDSFGELYQILEGEVIFLCQKRNNLIGAEIEDVFYTTVKKNEYILLPPYYGHIMINAGKTTLKTCNWVSKQCRSDYNNIKNFKGGCYFYTLNGWIKNNNYKIVPELREQASLKEKPKNLDYLYGKL